MNCRKYTIPVQYVNNKRSQAGDRMRSERMQTLYFLLNFSVTPKLL